MCTYTIPWLGTFELATIKVLAQNFMPAGGVTNLPVSVPNNVSLIGREVFFQSVQNDTGGATSSYLFSLVEDIEIQP